MKSVFFHSIQEQKFIPHQSPPPPADNEINVKSRTCPHPKKKIAWKLTHFCFFFCVSGPSIRPPGSSNSRRVSGPSIRPPGSSNSRRAGHGQHCLRRSDRIRYRIFFKKKVKSDRFFCFLFHGKDVLCVCVCVCVCVCANEGM